MNINFLKTVILTSIAITMSQCTLDTVEPLRNPEKPNIILILMDDMGWKDIGVLGSTLRTPNLDRLAERGITFTNAYANAPNCAPSRASILSGQYTPRHGIFTVGNSDRGDERLRKLIPITTKTVLDSRIVTLAEALKPYGYINAHIGKWQLGEGLESGPLSQGFDINIGGIQSFPARYFSPYNNPEIKDGPRGEFLTDRLTDEVLRFIDVCRSNSYQDHPFFIYLSHFAVHTPYQANEELVTKYLQSGMPMINAAYAAMVENVDSNIGRIINKLEKLKLSENTVIFFLSDNGGSDLTGSIEPLRGSKGMLYEGGIRVPAIVSWPGNVNAGSICDEPVIGTDLYPTVLQLAGIPVPSEHVLDGESLVPLLSECGSLNREAVFWYFPAYIQEKRGSLKPWRITPSAAVRKGKWKLIKAFEDNHLELYNLEDDPGEKNNLAGTMKGMTDNLNQLLTEWLRSVDAPIPTEQNPNFDPAMRK